MLERTLALVFLEIRTAWRRPLWWVLLVTLMLLTYGLSSGNVMIGAGGTSTGAERAWVNSQYSLAFGDVLVYTLLYMFFIAVAFGSAIPDDEELRTGNILRGTRLTTTEYIAGRWLGVAAVASAVMLVHLAAQMAAYQFYPLAEPEKLRGPFSAWNFIVPFALFIALPSLCLGAFTFAIGAILRQSLVVFLVPTGILLASIFFLWSWSPEWLSRTMNEALCIADPTGFRWLNETWVKHDQGAAFYNTTPLGLNTTFWANRLWQVVLAVGSLAAAAIIERRRLRRPFAVPAAERAEILHTQDMADATQAADAARGDSSAGNAGIAGGHGATGTHASARTAGDTLRDLAMRQRTPGWLGTMLAQARAEASELRRSPGLWIFVPLITLQVFGNSMGNPGQFNTPVLVTPGVLAGESFNTVTLLSLLLVLFYATESLARDDRNRMAPITASSAARSSARLAGKLLANITVVLAALLGVIYATLVVITVVQFVSAGVWVAPTPGPLLQAWGFFLIPTVVAWLGMIALVWCATRNRYAVYGTGLGVLVATGLLFVTDWVNWVGNWHLWGGVRWSDFGSFQLDREALVLNRVAWLLVGVLLVQVALLVERRRAPDPNGVISRARPVRALKAALPLLPVGLAAGTAMVALALAVRAGSEGGPAKEAARAYHTANARTWLNAKDPAIAALDIDITLDPAAGTFTVQGEYELSNPHDEPLTRFALTPGAHFEDVVFTFAGADHTTEHAKVAARSTHAPQPVECSEGLWVFRPQEPLAPGARVRVGFRYHGAYPPGIGRNARPAAEFILPAGVVLNSFGTSFLPLVGWVESIGVEPEYAAAPRRPEADDWMRVTKPGLGTGGAMATRATITLPEAYRAHAPGVLERDTTADGWRTMEWVADEPVRFFNIVAAQWAETKGETTSIWHLPQHAHNIPTMVEALDGARAWYSEWFHPYPWRDLRLSEFPGLEEYAQGFGTNIVFSESIGFLARPSGAEDAPFLITAHEAAHQWWGNMLMPGDGPGGNILSEGLAHYSTARLFEQMRGDAARRAFLRGIEESYGNERVPDNERALVHVDGSRGGDQTVTYDKGGWVFWMLHDLMGTAACDAGTRDFITRFKDGPDYPLLQDYVAVMREHAPDTGAFDEFVAQWFFTVVLPEFVIGEATTRQEGDAWVTTVTVTNTGTGRVRVPVAVTNGVDRDKAVVTADAAPPLVYADERAFITVGAGETATVEITTAWKPATAVVDPDVRQLQAKRKNAARGVVAQ